MILKDANAVDEVTNYVHALQAKQPEKTMEGGDAKKGKFSYAVCATCHGPEAKGNKALNAPSLRYLPDWYMFTQLKKFKEGIRGAHPQDLTGMTMRPMALTLVDEQAMKDVIAYITSLFNTEDQP